MLKLLTVALVTSVAVVAQDGEPTDSYQEVMERFQKEYLKYQGKPPTMPKDCDGNVNKENVTYYLYVYNNKYPLNDILKLNNSLFNPNYRTIVMIHGWLEGETDFDYTNQSYEYYIRGQPVNFIGVDWSNCSYCTPYGTVIVNKIVPKLAAYVGELLQTLVQQGVNTKNIHIIGFGTGAHIAGLAATHVEPKIGRITGLSPTGPFWDSKPNNERLQKTDAEFVDVIHTAQKQNGLGSRKTLADIEFRPNGGLTQPVSKTQPEIYRFITDHLAARWYFRESIFSQEAGFVGKLFNGTFVEFENGNANLHASEVMGEGISTMTRGNVYLYTNDATPYAMGPRGAYPAYARH